MDKNGRTFKIKDVTRGRCRIQRVLKEDVTGNYLTLGPHLLHLLGDSATLDFPLYVLLGDELIEYVKPDELCKEYVQEIIKAAQTPGTELEVFIRNSDETSYFQLLDKIRRQRIMVLAEGNKEVNAKILDVIGNICSITPKLVRGGIDQKVAEEVTLMAGGILDMMTHDAIILRTLVKMIKLDATLYDHSATVAILGGIIARNVLMLPSHQVAQIIEAGLYHDVGKTCVPGHLQHKAGKYDTEEQSAMRSHTILGYEELNKAISKGAKIDRLVAKVALEHHERFEGQGYPRGLRGRAEQDPGSGIHLYSRVVMIADTFTALIVEKIYRAAYSVDESIKIMAATSSEEFDPDIIHPFLKMVLQSFYDPEKIREIYPIKKKNVLHYAG